MNDAVDDEDEATTPASVTTSKQRLYKLVLVVTACIDWNSITIDDESRITLNNPACLWPSLLW